MDSSNSHRQAPQPQQSPEVSPLMPVQGLQFHLGGRGALDVAAQRLRVCRNVQQRLQDSQPLFGIQRLVALALQVEHQTGFRQLIII